jgi:beta-lactamase regulating signal transducer with metallopeptidase domain
MNLLIMMGALTQHGEAIPALWDGALKGLLLLALAGLATLLFRRASAALRHLIWAAALGGTVLLPVLSILLPEWRVPWMPRWTEIALQPASQKTVRPPEAIRSRVSAPFESTGDSSAAIAPAHFEVPVSNSDENSPPSATSNASPFMEDLEAAPALPEFWRWSLLAWLAGSGAALLPLAFGWLQVARLTRRCESVTDPAWLELLANIGVELGLRRQVSLRWSRQVAMPLTWGALRPVLLLPDAASDWSWECRRLVLLHELAHIKRWDWLTQTLAYVVCAIYWFNPLVWLAARRMRIEREQACDDLVLRCGSRPSDYADELLKFATGPGGQGLLHWAAVPMARHSSIEGRLLAILDGGRNRRALTHQLAASALALLTAVVVPMAMLRAASNKEVAAAGGPTNTVGQARQFVRMVVGLGALNFEGKSTTWEQLPELFAKVPDRTNTVLELAVSSDNYTMGQLSELQVRATLLSRSAGFEYLSFIGVHPLASLGSPAAPRQTVTPNAPKPAASKPVNNPTGGDRYRFGPVVELTWPVSDGGKRFLTLDDGQFHFGQFQLSPPTNRPTVHIGQSAGGELLIAFEKVYNFLEEKARGIERWNSMSAAQHVQEYRDNGFALLPNERSGIYPIRKDRLPMTFNLPTAGFLQVTEVLDSNPPSVKIRYKLVAQVSPPHANPTNENRRAEIQSPPPPTLSQLASALRGFQIPATTNWGEAVEGFRVRLQTDEWGISGPAFEVQNGGVKPTVVLRPTGGKTNWYSTSPKTARISVTRMQPIGLPRILHAEFENLGPRLFQTTTNEYLWQIEVDGRWFRGLPQVGALLDLKAGEIWTNLNVTLSEAWQTAHPNELSPGLHGGGGIMIPSDFKREALMLTPGRHTIRLGVIGLPARAGSTGPVRAISNSVQIEITPSTLELEAQTRAVERLIRDAPVSTGYSLEIWEETPGLKGDYRIRRDVIRLPLWRWKDAQGVEVKIGEIFQLTARNSFYVQWDAIGSSTLHYYGPFEGDPVKMLGKLFDLPPSGASATGNPRNR